MTFVSFENVVTGMWSGSDAPFVRYSPLSYTVTLKLGFRVIKSGTIR